MAFNADKREEDSALLTPLSRTGRGFYIALWILLSLMGWALFAWIHQLRNGLGVTGLNRPVFWGFYITNFVFFIGISHAGTLISAILRIFKAEWRRPFTRAAEAVTVFSLPFGAGSLIIDMGRPDRFLNVLKHPQIQSPIIWDVFCVSTYLFSSCLYFYLALIPDIAICRDTFRQASWPRRTLYRILALGWQGTERQRLLLEKIINGMSIFLTLLVVTVHTVVSWVFGMTVQPGWHSAIIGPYFLVGAIFSGVAAVAIVMAILRRVFHLEAYVRKAHFDNIGVFLLCLTLLWFYFTFAEFITTVYGGEPSHMRVFFSKFSGEFAVFFWLMILCCFVIPLVLLANRRTRTISGIVTASVFINIGMWLERFTVIVPSLTRPRLPYEPGIYFPTWVEGSITVGCFSAFIFLLMLFTKVFPIISIWEMRESREKTLSDVEKRIRSYLPETAILALFFILVPVTSLAEALSPESGAVSGNLVKGQRLVVQKGCMKCHSLWGEGGQLGPDLTRVGQDKTLLQLAGLLWGHSPKMTEVMIQKGIQRPEFTPEEMNDLISFLYSLTYFSEPGDPIKGRIQFSEKGCVICHAVSGKGGQLAPALDKYGKTMSPILMAQAMWNHGPAMAKKMEEKGVKRPYFEGGEMTHLLAYVRSVGVGEWEERIYTLPGSPKEGKRLFREKKCITCHAIRGEGGAVGPDLGAIKLNKNVAEIAGHLWNHSVKMWAKMQELSIEVPKFEENEMSDLLAYLYFIRYVDPPGNPQTGEAVFHKKGCISCHPLGGKSRGIGPNLSQSEKITSPVDIATTMWNHAPVMEELMKAGGQEWPRFEGDEMRDLVEYLKSLKGEQNE